MDNLKALTLSRFYHSIAVVGDYIFVCGGYNEHFVLDSLEKYHPLYNEWVDMAKMLTGKICLNCYNGLHGILLIWISIKLTSKNLYIQEWEMPLAQQTNSVFT